MDAYAAFKLEREETETLEEFITAVLMVISFGKKHFDVTNIGFHTATFQLRLVLPTINKMNKTTTRLNRACANQIEFMQGRWQMKLQLRPGVLSRNLFSATAGNVSPTALLLRRPYCVVIAALANKLARTAWAVLIKGKAFAG